MSRYHATAPLGETPLKKPLKNPPIPLTQIRYPPIYAPGSYKVLYIDPPWEYRVFSAKGTGRSASQHYNVMTLADIKALPIQHLMHKDSACLMWVTSPGLVEGLEALSAWGFRYTNVAFTWIKRNKNYEPLQKADVEAHRAELARDGGLSRAASKKLLRAAEQTDSYFFGLGHFSRQNAEFCLLGTRGKTLPRASHAVRSEITTPLGRHSAKPLEVRRRIESLFGDVPRIEGFARSRGEGWDAFGYEISGLDCRDEVKRFLPRPVSDIRQPTLFPVPPCRSCRKPMAFGQNFCYLCGTAVDAERPVAGILSDADSRADSLLGEEDEEMAA